jgi:hypothetical protein
LQQNLNRVKFTPKNLNKFLLFKLPSAFFTGVRVRFISNKKAVVNVKHRWISQNPFNSLYYGVQAMAAELSTGVLVLKQIAESKQKISMLVTSQTASFTKKGRGVIQFTCTDGEKINRAIQETIKTGEGQILILKSQGLNENGEQISIFEFEWSIKKK